MKREKKLPKMLETALTQQIRRESNTYGKKEITDSSKILRKLWEAIGEESIKEWVRRAVILLQSEKILLPPMCEHCERTSEVEERHDETQDEQTESKGKCSSCTMCYLWERGVYGGTPHRRESVKQLSRELDAFMQELSFQATPTEVFMRCLWESFKSEESLFKTLSAIAEREIGDGLASADVRGSSATDDREGKSAVGFPLGFRPENVRLYDEQSTTLCNGTRPDFTVGVIEKRNCEGFDVYNQALTGDKTMTVTGAATDPPHIPCTVYSVENHPADSRVNVDDSGKVQTLTSRMGTGGGNVPMVMEPKVYGISPYDSNGMKSENPHSGFYEADTSRTLDANGGNPACNQGGMAIVEPKVIALDRASFNQGENAKYDFEISDSGKNSTLVAKGPSAVCYRQQEYIVRRLTPTECARLQGFPDKWGHIRKAEDFTDEEWTFWARVRNTYAKLNGKAVKFYSKTQMIKWYNKLHTDSAEYKMWGNGIALPCALYVMEGIAEALKKEEDNVLQK